MSEAWKKARKHLDSLGKCPALVKEAELESNYFEEGDFTVDFYREGCENQKMPEMLGMNIGESINKLRYDKILELAKEEALKVKIFDENPSTIYFFNTIFCFSSFHFIIC